MLLHSSTGAPCHFINLFSNKYFSPGFSTLSLITDSSPLIGIPGPAPLKQRGQMNEKSLSYKNAEGQTCGLTTNNQGSFFQGAAPQGCVQVGFESLQGLGCAWITLDLTALPSSFLEVSAVLFG